MLKRSALCLRGRQPQFFAVGRRLSICYVQHQHKGEERSERYEKGGYHPLKPGATLNDKYLVMKKLGFGQFSTVWLARNQKPDGHRSHVAIKVLTADSSQDKHVDELKVLKKIRNTAQDHPGYNHVIQLLDDFRIQGPHGEHLCLVFDVLGMDIKAVRDRFEGNKLPMNLLKQVARQTLWTLDYLHTKCKIIHCDVQPGNILVEVKDPENVIDTQKSNEPDLSNLERSHPIVPSQPLFEEIQHTQKISIRLTDLGIAMPVDHDLKGTIQPTALRAPEVTLGIKWDTAIDIWGAGCVLFELAVGHNLFLPQEGETWREEDDHLAQMTAVLGDIPKPFIDRGARSSKFFNEEGALHRVKDIPHMPLEEVLEWKLEGVDAKERKEFGSLLTAMLQFDPKERASATELLKYPWLKEE